MFIRRYQVTYGSVADPHHFDADSDPAGHFDADPVPDPAYHFNGDPDLAYHFDADPDPTFQFDADYADPDLLHCHMAPITDNEMINNKMIPYETWFT